MEAILMNNSMEDDFTIKSIETVELKKDDPNYDESRPLITAGVAERSDGAQVAFFFTHSKESGVVSSGLVGSEKAGQLKIGFYLRKEEKASESRIIGLSNLGRLRN